MSVDPEPRALMEGTPEEARAMGEVAADVLNSIPSSSRQESYYHYTSASGLKGIIEENTLHYSDTKFLNDGSEGKWGLEVLKTYIDDLATTSSDRAKTFLQAMYDAEKGFSDDFRSVVFCMSRQGNLLNQWRDYGKDVVPYCIELDSNFITGKHGADFSASLRPIIYDDGQQKAAVADLISRLFKIMAPLWDNLSDLELSRMALYASFEAGHLLGHFKHPAFEAEQEVRLRIARYSLSSEGIKPYFRSSSLGLVPFYKWKPEAKLKIRSVRVGPSPHSDASLDALKEFLAANDLDCEATVSSIPIRR